MRNRILGREQTREHRGTISEVLEKSHESLENLRILESRHEVRKTLEGQSVFTYRLVPVLWEFRSSHSIQAGLVRIVQ